MRLFVHQLAWDVRRHRLIVAGWLFLLAANAALDALWPTLALERTTRDAAGTIGGLLAATEVLFSMVLVAEIIQSNSAVGTTAFWMTRPIPSTTLAGTKLALLAGTMVLVPAGIDLLAMLAYRVPIADALAVMAQTALFWAVWVTVLAALAVVTPNMPKFALACGSVLAAIVTMMIITFTVILQEIEGSSGDGAVAASAGTSELFVPLLAVVAVVMVFVQHGTRQRVRTFMTAVLGILAVYTIDVSTAGMTSENVTEPPAWTAAPAMLDLVMNADTVSAEESRSFRGDRTDWQALRARVSIRGIAPGWTADVRLIRAEVRVPDKGALSSAPTGWYSSEVPIDDLGDERPKREVTRRLLSVNSIADGAPHERGENTVVLLARRSDVEPLATTQGSYDGRFLVSLSHHDIEAVLPLTRGAEYHHGPYRIAIARVDSESRDITVLAGQSDAISIFRNRSWKQRTFYLRNRRTSEAVLGSVEELRADVSLMRILPFAAGFGADENAGFRAHMDSISFPAYESDRGTPRLDRNWAENAELVIVRTTGAGAVERRLTVPNFPIVASK